MARHLARLGRATHRAAIVAALAATTVVFAACGGSSGDEGAEPAPSTTTAVATTVVSNDPFCQKVSEASAKFGLSTSGANLGAILQQLPEAAALLQQARAVAPAEVAADLDVLAGTLSDLTPLLSRVAALSAASKTDMTKAAELQQATLELTTKLPAIQSPAFNAAVANLNAYSKQHCGVSFG